MGVSITIDDFGTGYSSLSYLARLPIQGVKIDQRFVHGLDKNRNDEAITQAIIALSHSLGLRVHRGRRRNAGAVQLPAVARLRGSAGLPDLASARGSGAARRGGASRKSCTRRATARPTSGRRGLGCRTSIPRVPPCLTMTIAEACILVACLLPVACAGIAKSKGFGKPRRDGGFDNHNPRQ